MPLTTGPRGLNQSRAAAAAADRRDRHDDAVRYAEVAKSFDRAHWRCAALRAVRRIRRSSRCICVVLAECVVRRAAREM